MKWEIYLLKSKKKLNQKNKAALASGSSKLLKFSLIIVIAPSKVFGYLLNISLKPIIASCITNPI